jgi:PhnB protein
MQLNPYLTFDGRCEEAFKFYEKALGGKIEVLQTHAGTPVAEHVPANWVNKILHAKMRIGDTELMASDAPPDRFQKPQGFSVALHLKDPAEAERIFHALAEKGTVQMPLEKTFWAERFGMVTDRFGIPWMVNCE